MARLDFESTMDRLMRMIQAGYPVIYLVSYEETRVFDCIARIVNRLRMSNKSKALFRWAQGTGLEEYTLGAAPSHAAPQWLKEAGVADPVPQAPKAGTENASGAIKQLLGSQQGKHSSMGNCVAVFLDLHPHLAQYQGTAAAEMVRPLRNAAASMRKYYDGDRGGDAHRYQTLIVVAPTASGLSPELHGDVVMLDFPLPEVDELASVLNGMVDRKLLKFPSPIPAEDLKAIPGSDSEYRNRVVELIAAAGRGLTRHAYQQGLNMIQVEQQIIRAKHVDYMMQLKANTISNPALQYTPRVEIELGGLEGVKAWARIRSGPVGSPAIRRAYRLPAPKGVMLCGASGGGKSQLAKLVAKQFNLALLRLDVGSLFGSFIGESEERTRRALQLAEVLAPVVLWIDEIDKAFAGAAGGTGDSGVSARVLGHFLTWLAEKQDDVFVVVTANKFERILVDFPEFGRKGRFDEIFWVGLPKDDARKEIFRIYLEPHQKASYLRAGATPLNAGDASSESLLDELVAVSEKMTGAEIESAINEALYRAYNDHQASRSADTTIPGATFTPELLVDVVKANSVRALYNGGDGQLLDGQERSAAERGWLDAETGNVVTAPRTDGVVAS